MTPVKLAIIGCGIAARDLHWPALQQLKDLFEIVLVCNHTPEKAAAFAEMVGGVPYVTDYQAVLNHDGVEAVDIVLPIHLNHEVTLAALEADKHVLLEKPLAANLGQATALKKRAGQSDRVTMVAENFRYHPGYRRVRSLVEADEIGTPHSATWQVLYRVDRHNKYAATRWRIQHQYPGGFILDGGIHNIAAIRDILGDITAGTAFTRSINPAIGEIDCLDFHFNTDRGIAGSLSILASAMGPAANRLQIFGDAGSIRVDGSDLRVYQAADLVREENLDNDMGYRGEFEDFYRAIRTGAAPVSSVAQACRDLEVMVTALTSANQQHFFRL